MKSGASTTMQSQLPRHNGSVLRFMVGCGGYSLLVAGVALLAWALWEGIVLPPEKRFVHPISRVGLPAAIACGLLGFTWLRARQALGAGRLGASFAYLALVPLAVVAVVTLLWLLDWLEV